METRLLLRYKDANGIDAPFPNSADQIEIYDFKYEATRMGNPPSITATVMYPICLDEMWDNNVYATFNGERYKIEYKPTSSYSNEDTRYKYSLQLVSERSILSNVYFYDVVNYDEELPESDKPASNNTNVVFFGNISDFVNRMNASLVYSNLLILDETGNYISGYQVVIDESSISEDVLSTEKLISFEDSFIADVLNEIYDTYEIPYYFEGKTIHLGFFSETSSQLPTFAYGVDDALLSISKNNTNVRIVNRATGIGSEDNIPYYYPNNSPKGDIRAVMRSSSDATVKIVDYELFANNVEVEDRISRKGAAYEDLMAIIGGTEVLSESYNGDGLMKLHGVKNKAYFKFTAREVGPITFTFEAPITSYIYNNNESIGTVPLKYNIQVYLRKGIDGNGERTWLFGIDSSGIYNQELFINEIGEYTLELEVEYRSSWATTVGDGHYFEYRAFWSFSPSSGWMLNGKGVLLSDLGLVAEGTLSNGDYITQVLDRKVKISNTLLPPIYRHTAAKDRFYNAVNGVYESEGYNYDYGDHVFNNPWTEGNPKEYILRDENIKPTIKDAVHKDSSNNIWQIDRFLDIAYDLNDNNETYEDTTEESDETKTYLKHPYFFVKLPPMGFNIFDSASAKRQMVIEMTSGDCGACAFEVAVDEDTQKNTVQVDADGNLIYLNDYVWCGSEEAGLGKVKPQDIQNDTTDHSVWIALRKEEDTYGVLMPYAPTYSSDGKTIVEAGHRPRSKADVIKDQEEGIENPREEDTFVITGILLPQLYIHQAEDKLETEIVKYLKENNDDQFSFGISFSRIYFAENPSVLALLNENSYLTVNYNNRDYVLYVSSFSYSMSEDEALPQINVELHKELSLNKNALQAAVDDTKKEINATLSLVSTAVIDNVAESFVSKKYDSTISGTLSIKKGLVFGEGGKVEVLDNNTAKLTIDYLDVTKKATFTSLEIQEKTHVGGQLLITLGAINCGEVEEFNEYYRCYFQTKGAERNEIYNSFVAGDQAICQTYNVRGSRYYWRLVIGVGDDYIDLSKIYCDPDSDAPMVGDKIVQFGHTDNYDRQNAIVLAAYGDGSPYFIQYQGINDFAIDDSMVVTKLSPEGNLITGVLKIQAGSSGIENINGIGDLDGANLLRNTGFTGDYLSANLADDMVLNSSSQLFSPPLDHWDNPELGVEQVALPNESASGYGVSFPTTTNTLIQEMYYSLIKGKTYTLTFKAKIKGSGLSTTVAITLGGVTHTVNISNLKSWTNFKLSFVMPDTPTNTFSISGSNFQICMLQLSQGAVASSWRPSPLDNASDRAYWQSMKYLSNAINESSTVINGGLVLSSIMAVGNYDGDSKTMTEITGGMSGNYTNENDISFWSGGSLEQAINTELYYRNNPTAQPTEEELANMAKFVVTHGGRAYLNDIILRGTVYAEDGVFDGTVIVETLDLAISTQNHRGGLFYEPNGHLCLNANAVLLPQLPSGVVRSIRIMNPNYYTAEPSNLQLKPASQSVRISTSKSTLAAVSTTVVISGKGTNSGTYTELLGWREDDSDITYWVLSITKELGL